METYTELLNDLRGPTRGLRHAIEDPWSGFMHMHESVLSQGALDSRIKELMALAIAVVRHCDGCIAHHAQAAARLGATPDEVAEALGVALLMDGGPATVYGPRAWQAYQEFAEHQRIPVAVSS